MDNASKVADEYGLDFDVLESLEPPRIDSLIRVFEAAADTDDILPGFKLSPATAISMMAAYAKRQGTTPGSGT